MHRVGGGWHTAGYASPLGDCGVEKSMQRVTDRERIVAPGAVEMTTRNKTGYVGSPISTGMT